MGVVGDDTRMTDHVKARGWNHLLEKFADGTVSLSCCIYRWNTMNRNFVFTNCDLRPDHG